MQIADLYICLNYFTFIWRISLAVFELFNLFNSKNIRHYLLWHQLSSVTLTQTPPPLTLLYSRFEYALEGVIFTMGQLWLFWGTPNQGRIMP